MMKPRAWTPGELIILTVAAWIIGWSVALYYLSSQV